MKIFCKILKKLATWYKSSFWTLEKQAIKAGVVMGSDNFIASQFWSTEPYLITIGNHCQITGGVKLFTHGGGGAVRRWYPKFDTFGKVHIGDYVYIGNDVKVMPGVTIGDNVLIAAGSIVTKSIPAGVVVAGNPAKFVCSIEDYLNRNLQYNTNTKGVSPEIKRKILLSMDDDKFMTKNLIKSN